MITFLAVPKPFRGDIARIQLNAIESWLACDPACEVMLFGHADGVREAAAALPRVTHVPNVATNRWETPLLGSVYELGNEMSSQPMVCFVNADIILMSDFAVAGRAVTRAFDRFVLAGRRWDLDYGEALQTSSGGWEKHLLREVRQRASQDAAHFIDYFLTPRGTFQDLPTLAIGRGGVDNWLIWKARSLKLPVIDASSAVVAVHQSHDHAHHAGGRDGAYFGEEAALNLALRGRWRQHFVFTLDDATHRLTRSGVKSNRGMAYYRRRWAEHWVPVWSWARLSSAPARSKLGLRRATIRSFGHRLRRSTAAADPHPR